MNDNTRVGIEAETPVNPYSLLEAVNRSSGAANTAWLIFVGMMAYLLITVAGVTHKDLLLNSAITLPILQVNIELTRFFLFAPIVLVLLHLGVVGQLVLLARKSQEFASAIRMLEITDARSHPLRLELDNFFFVQAMAGPERSRIVSTFLHGMSWLTLVLLPLLLLLYIQVVFLPYHDVAITWVHRVAVLADIVLLLFIGVFLARPETTFFRAFWRTSMHQPLGLLATAVLLIAVSAFSLLAATVPGEGLERVATGWPVRGAAADDRRMLEAADAGSPVRTDALLGVFHRNLRVTDQDLVLDRDASAGEATLNLRNRDLRFAHLDRTDLHQADLTGANLDGASLIGADLRGAILQCASLDELLLTENRRAARCTSARAADFSRARLDDARMAGVDLRGASLAGAQMSGAELSHGLMMGADFSGAAMERASLSGGASLQGANFLLARLQGADLSGAKLHMADLSNAKLEGANLALANLEGAVMRDAELDGASLRMSRLLGTDMRGTSVQGADLSGAVVWRALPPIVDTSATTDLSQVVLQPPGDQELAALTGTVSQMDATPLRVRFSEGLGPLLDAPRNAQWSGSPELAAWRGLATSADTAVLDPAYRARLTEYLNRLACRGKFASGAVASGIARRAMAEGFKGDMPAIYDRLRAADCAAAASMSPRLMKEMAAAADAVRGQ